MKGFVIAAPTSGAGTTTVTLGLLRAYKNRGVKVISAKSGPDYIDPQFHTAASGYDCVNLDAWAMSPEQLRGLAAQQDGDLLIVEGAMGLFDGAPDRENPMGKGSAADLAEALDLPVVLVLDVTAQAQTAAVVVKCLAEMRPTVKVAGVILNQIGSPRHGEIISRAMHAVGIPVIGIVPRTSGVITPSRHLGLVQAGERDDLEEFINLAANLLEDSADLDALSALASKCTGATRNVGLPALGKNIAIAKDHAFAFAYPHILDDWREAGAKITFFSPLADEGPDAKADAIYLPGGYPELHAKQLADNENFRHSMEYARDRNAVIYGECGGYMVLGENLIDAKGKQHRMLGFLPVSTSFAVRKLHLGYRDLAPQNGALWQTPLKAHEFHYATITAEETTGRLFKASDALGENLPDMGHVRGNVSGSFAHIIAPSGG